MLGIVSGAVVDQFDELEGAVCKSCPTLPDEAKATVMQVIASARKEWIRSTSRRALEASDSGVVEGSEDDSISDVTDEESAIP